MTFAAILVGLFIFFGLAGLFSGNSAGNAYEEYHHDPYYYYPRTPGPPVQMGGYYQTPPPQYYQQSYYQQPYYENAPRYIPSAVRPEYGRASGLGSFLMTIFLISAIFFLAVKADLVSLTINIGSHPASEYNSSNQANFRTDPGQQQYSDYPNTYALNKKK